MAKTLRQVNGTYVYPDASKELDFSGSFDLDHTAGIYYNDYTQTDDVELSISEASVVGGNARVKIIANGDAITLDNAYTWTNVGSEEISTVAADENILMVNRVSATEIEYAVKVV